jgi:hypothetical protein
MKKKLVWSNLDQNFDGSAVAYHTVRALREKGNTNPIGIILFCFPETYIYPFFPTNVDLQINQQIEFETTIYK